MARRTLVSCRRSTARTSLWIGLRDFHLLAVYDRVRRTDDDGFLAGEAGDDFDFGSEIAAGADGDELGPVVLDGGHLQALSAENQRIHGNDERGNIRGNFQVHFGKGTGKEFASGIIHVYFDQQGARSQVNGVSSANEFSLELAAGKLRESEISGDARLSRGRIRLRDVDEYAQRANGGHVEKFLRRTARAGIN